MIGGFPLPNMPTEEQLDTLFKELKKIVLRPEFQSMVAQIPAPPPLPLLPPDEGAWTEVPQLGPEMLQANFIEIPENVKILASINPAAVGEGDMAVGFTIPFTGINFYIAHKR